jgi:hypothetical protein
MSTKAMLVSRVRSRTEAIFRLWLDVHPAIPLLAIGSLVAMVFLVSIIPIGTARVAGIVDREYTEVGTRGLIYHGLVRVRGLPMYVNVLTPPNCSQGDLIDLVRISHVWGSSFSASVSGCRR